VETFDALVCGGGIFTDLIFASIPRMPNPGEEVFCGQFEVTGGGAPFITAVALARLGMKVAIVVPLGTDIFSRYLLERLEKEGVCTEHILQLGTPLRSVTVAMNYGGDRSFLSYQDTLESDAFAEHAQTTIDKIDAKFLHIDASLHMIPVIQKARDKNMKIVLDVGWDDSWLFDERLKDVLKLGDIFTPNLPESLAITGTDTPEKAIEELRNIVPTVVIKLGPAGALYSDSSGTRTIPGFVADPVDTTGAGDNFCAGLIAGLAKGWHLERAIRLGNFCGARSVEGMGGNTTSPTWHMAASIF
jgi:sugar/nucleoside kinase (ribokinase family)